MSEPSKIKGLIFCKADEIYEDELDNFVQQFIDANEIVIPRTVYNQDLPFKKWQKKQILNSQGLGLSDNRVPATLYFLVDSRNRKILGAIQVRHKLNDRLTVADGNIGYGVIPVERRKGYATLMLQFALAKCRQLGLNKVLLSCNVINTASAKTILKLGGVFENESNHPDDGHKIKRYWITI